MLTLTRRLGERIVIGSNIEVEVVHLSSGRVRLGIRAPRSLPVHRGELVDRIEAENLRASTERAKGLAAEPIRREGSSVLTFPEGLFGMRDQHEFLLCELEEQPLIAGGVADSLTLRALVCVENPMLRLLVVDVLTIHPEFPLSKARAAANLLEEVAVAAIVTVPSSGDDVTVNLVAPLVIGLESRRGAQVIVDEEGLDVGHPILAAPSEREGGARAEAGQRSGHGV
ncbi:MAG: carbon storage regulator [Myxococcales bacterium]|nr:carbon storage regulator [Myxococcales bacterium]